MDTKDSRAIFEQAKQCYDNEYWSDALHHIDELSCEMTENKDVMYMRALCQARMGNIEESELLCDQLIVLHQSARAKQLKTQLGQAKREEKEKPKEKQPFQVPTFIVPSIIILVIVFLAVAGIHYGLNAKTNYIPPAMASVAAPSAERTLNFGAAGVTGDLHTRKWSYDIGAPIVGDNFWKNIGQATGQISIPLGLELRLNMTDVPQVNLAGLRHLKSDDLQVLDFEGAMVTDADLENIEYLFGLRDLSLNDTQVTSEGLAKLRRLTSLWSLGLSGIALEEEGWQVVGTMPYLRHVVLDRTDVSDMNLAALCLSAPSLVSISVDENPQLTDTGIVEIGKLDSLKHLYLSYTGITDEGLKSIQELDNLDRIYLEGTSVTDKSIAGFTKMRSIRYISLARTQITDAALEELKEIQGLTNLDITDCPFLTEAAIESFRQALPNCSVGLAGNITNRPAMWDEPV